MIYGGLIDFSIDLKILKKIKIKIKIYMLRTIDTFNQILESHIHSEVLKSNSIDRKLNFQNFN